MDRYRSLLNNSLILEPSKGEEENINQRPLITPLRVQFENYRRARTYQQQRVYLQKFKQEQNLYHRKLKLMTTQLEGMTGKEYEFTKRQLIFYVQEQMNLELEFGQLVQSKTNKLQSKGSNAIKYAVKDIQEKYQELKYLEKSIQQCLNMLSIIGVLVKGQGQKIDQIAKEVQNANLLIGKTEDNVKKAVQKIKKRRRRMCILILIAIGVIILLIITLFAIKVI